LADFESIQILLHETQQTLEVTKNHNQQLERERHEWTRTREAEITQHSQSVAQLQNELKTREKQINDLVSERDKLQTQYQRLVEEHNALRRRVEELHATLASKHSEIEAMTQQIRSLICQQTEITNQLHERVRYSHFGRILHSSYNISVAVFVFRFSHRHALF